jgi:glutaredoxin
MPWVVAVRYKSAIGPGQRFLPQHQYLPHPSLTLYLYTICPYCNIAKAVLNCTNTKFTIQEVNPLTKEELKNLPDPTYGKVPILLAQQSNGKNGEQNK